MKEEYEKIEFNSYLPFFNEDVANEIRIIGQKYLEELNKKIKLLNEIN